MRTSDRVEPRRRPAPRFVGTWKGAALLSAALSGCSGVLDPQGPVGEANRSMLGIALTVMLCIVVPTLATALGFAWWYRKGNRRAERRPGFVYSGRIELIVWSIPLMTIMFLGGVAWVGSHDLDPYKPLPGRGRAVEVQVVALDWKWLFIYPEYGVASVNQLALPVGRPVHFSLTSASVMNTFFVPKLGSMIYAMNGMSTQLNLRADRPGVFRGMSGHFSGDGFSDMHFDALALPEDRFAAWVNSARHRGGALDAEAYRRLAVQSSAVPVATYGAVQPRLYDAVVRQTLPPGPGPDPAAPKTNVSPGTES